MPPPYGGGVSGKERYEKGTSKSFFEGFAAHYAPLRGTDGPRRMFFPAHVGEKHGSNFVFAVATAKILRSEAPPEGAGGETT